MKALVLLNTAAGSVDDSATRAEAERVGAALERAGVDVEMRAVPFKEIAEAARRGAGSGVDAVVVGGGDGTLSAAAGALVGSGVPLGVLPLGTRNNFARDLTLPLELEEAARALAAGHVRAIDVGEVNGRVFLNNCSIGLYPWAVAEREEREEQEGWGRWRALIHGGLGALRRFRVLRLRLRTEGGERAVATPLVFVGNNHYQLSLPTPGRRDSLDGGQLCLFVARSRGRLGFVWSSLLALAGRLDQARDLEAHEVSEVEIETGSRPIAVAVDGEVVRLRTPLRFRIRPRALHVIAPPAGASVEPAEAPSGAAGPPAA